MIVSDHCFYKSIQVRHPQLATVATLQEDGVYYWSSF